MTLSRIAFALLLTAVLLGNASTGGAQSLDPYGGYTNLPVPGGATGYFRVQNVGGRWIFATPQGNAFWLRAVYNTADIGMLTFPGKYPDKYTWGTQANRRLKAWGFNAIGEYSSTYVSPIPLYGGTWSNPEKLPFIRLVSVEGSGAFKNRWGWADDAVKDLIEAVDYTVYTGYRGNLPDLFDPGWLDMVKGAVWELGPKSSTWTGSKFNPLFRQGLTTEPWLLGTSFDDADHLYGFRRAASAHPGYFIAIAKPTILYSGAANPTTASKMLGTVATGNGTTMTFSVNVAANSINRLPINPGALKIAAGSQRVFDDGAGNLTGSGTGTINYATGDVMVTFTTPPGSGTGIYVSQMYANPTLYSKVQWQQFLQAKYGTIAALNAAWGSTYTTFGSNGDWPNGTGLMDESGRHSWFTMSGPVGSSKFSWAVNAVVNADLDAFIEFQYAERYFSTFATELRAYTPHHLIFSPAAFEDGQPYVNRTAAKYIDVYQSAVPVGQLATMEQVLNRVVATFPGPIFMWTTFTAQADSPLASCANTWADLNSSTQAERGQAYASYLTRLLNYKSPSGVYPIVGLDWWAWTDSAPECTNFGLVSRKDNAYDGREATIASGTDAWGYPTGGEVANYGDFLGSVVSAHVAIEHVLSGQ